MDELQARRNAGIYYAVNKGATADNQIALRLGPGNPRLSGGGAVVFFVRIGEDVEFTGTAMIHNVRESGEEDIPIQTAVLVEIRPFDDGKDRSLAALAGSLRKVYRYLAPERHFSRPVVRLCAQDFQTIADAKTDIHRSIFRYMFSALPLEAQAQFVQNNITEFERNEDGTVRSYVHLAKAIVEHYRENVTTPIRMLATIESVCSRIPDFPQLPNWYVSRGDGEGRIPFGRHAQELAELFRASPLLSRAVEGSTLLDEAIEQLSERVIHGEEYRWHDQIF